MIIVYLPRNPKYGAFIERAIEFLEQVYKDEVLADLKFVAYFLDDPGDLAEVGKLDIGIKDIGLFSHYNVKTKTVVVAEEGEKSAMDVFRVTVEEVTHHTLYGTSNMERIIEALLNDIPRLRTFVARVSESDIWKVHRFINEFYTKYVVFNYFVELNDKPVLKPWEHGKLDEEMRLYYMHSRTWEKSEAFHVINIIYWETMLLEKSLPNFREAIHSIFTEAIKRFPVEVYGSNLPRYEILYREQRIRVLPI